MTTTVAIYEALIQANVPPPAARRAAEALEADMTQRLATKQDMALLGERLNALDARLSQRIDDIDARMNAQFATAGAQLDPKLQNLESRIVVRLGGLMTFLFTIAGAALGLLR